MILITSRSAPGARGEPQETASCQAVGLAARYVLRRLVRRSALALVCSETDRRKVLAIEPRATVAILPNVVPPHPPLPEGETAHAVFVWRCRLIRRMADAMRWLVAEIWPRIRQTLPQAKLTVAGVGTEQVVATDPASGSKSSALSAIWKTSIAQARLPSARSERQPGPGSRSSRAAMSAVRRFDDNRAEGLNFEDGTAILLRDDADSFATPAFPC